MQPLWPAEYNQEQSEHGGVAMVTIWGVATLLYYSAQVDIL
jgi:hypothetical protein